MPINSIRLAGTSKEVIRLIVLLNPQPQIILSRRTQTPRFRGSEFGHGLKDLADAVYLGCRDFFGVHGGFEGVVAAGEFGDYAEGYGFGYSGEFAGKEGEEGFLGCYVWRARRRAKRAWLLVTIFRRRVSLFFRLT